MKTRISILLGAFAAALFIGTIAFLTQWPRPVESALNSVEPSAEAKLLPAHSATIPAAHKVPSASVTPSVTTADLPEVAREPAHALRVPAELVLAKVNGQHIRLKDLVPLEPQETEKVVTPEEYESRLNRAIEMELTFAAAAAQGVALTPEQSKRVNSIAQKHEATFREYNKQGITWSSLTAAQLEFEQRLTAALMLQQNLVAKEAGVAPSSSAAIQAQYEEALRSLIARLKASANISGS